MTSQVNGCAICGKEVSYSEGSIIMHGKEICDDCTKIIWSFKK